MQAEEYMAADIAKKGEHFLMGQAGENGKKVDFELFPLDKYEKEK